MKIKEVSTMTDEKEIEYWTGVIKVDVDHLFNQITKWISERTLAGDRVVRTEQWGDSVRLVTIHESKITITLKLS